MNVDIVGYVGGSIASLSMIIQVVKSYKQHSVSDFSWIMLLLNTSGNILIIVYAFLIQKPAIYCTVLVSLSCLLMILGMKIYFEHYKKLNITSQLIQPSLNRFLV
uniref:PQ-loop repeat-containing protein n=1 Tax=viral metagenome TaxID=1070528 RepID=A0A6C0CRA9_9ZZZZ